MNQTQIAKVLPITRAHLCNVLNRKSIPSRNKAVVLQTGTGIPAKMWREADKATLRQRWNKFLDDCAYGKAVVSEDGVYRRVR